ncbi:EAL domain-containing protein [Caballeronia sp. LZ025]|uniref:bifunctional diguanylate cyclase/phosphodiesterase n=1 Tax=Caballeronia TaxID=1827195 RepID=UPI001FD5F8D9|nr:MULTISPECIES: EAL domain-containing protein [Caballeronia]MDR5733963.1 EAL domain-containing protein [Caballeronia sp. LZ025]
MEHGNTPGLQVIDCILHEHDRSLMLLACVVCAIGIYASFAVGRHAARASGKARVHWGIVNVVASGCTAWATHFIVLLAFEPQMPAAFEPYLTAVSLACAIVGIGASVTVSIAGAQRSRQVLAGLIIGTGVAALHYIGQSAYLVQGTVSWDVELVLSSIGVSLPLFGVAMLAIANRDRRIRKLAAPLMLLAIALLHFCGMGAMTLRYEPTVVFPSDAVLPRTVTPVVAGVSIALIMLAVLGWRFDLAAKARIRQDRRRLRDLADVALEGLLITQSDVIVTSNSSVERLSGFAPEELTGTHVSTLLPDIDLGDLPEKEERETELVGATGQRIPVRVLRSEVPLGHKLQTVFAVRDQRERLRTEAKMRALAYNDSLTGLPNRASLYELLTLHTALPADTGEPFAVIMVDLDRFKQVNDTFGHPIGDDVLVRIAERLRAIVRADDVVARLGGDEFAVMQRGADAETACTLCVRIVDASNRETFVVGGQSIHLGASVGFALYPEDGRVPAELLRNADLALYAAKADGKGVHRRYEPALNDKTQERQALEAGLRRALTDGHLELHYQPLVDAQSGRIASAEALVRWRHPDRGLVSPAEFIEIAEESGIIIPLGDWVLRTACAQAATWHSHVGVAVNLSPVQFRDKGLASNVRSALQDAALPPERLELAITEGVLLMDEARTLQTLNELRAMHVRVSMDDFGTGYSSLSYIRKFPFDKIKIDKSFVRNIPEDAESVAIVRAIITMSACLGLPTTMEGVETADQFRFAVAEGCSAIQGYFVSPPVPTSKFQALLEQDAFIGGSEPEIDGRLATAEELANG